MINYPVTYHRNFCHDLPHLKPVTPDPSPDNLWEKCQKCALVALSLFTIHRPFRGPLSCGMSVIRSFAYGAQAIQDLSQGRLGNGCFDILQVGLASAAVALFFFNPVLCFLFSSISDITINSKQLIESLQAGKIKEALEALAFLLLDLLFIASFCFGTIEVTIACMLFQIALDLYLSAEHMKQGNCFEAGCHAILAGARLQQAIPQLKLLNWKWTHGPTLTAELKQAPNGFVYLDIPDDDLYALFKLYADSNMELPPYFGKGSAGAHVTVIPADEMLAAGINLSNEIGKKFSFRISNVDNVKPAGWGEVKRVHFVTLSSPELETMRASYGLSSKIQDHDFHLTFGIEKS